MRSTHFKNLLCQLAIILFFIACNKEITDVKSIRESNFRNAYIVDTIRIVSPIRVFYTDNKGHFTSFYTSEAELSTIKKRKFDDILTNKKVYLYSSNIYTYLPISDFFKYKEEKYKIPDHKNLDRRMSFYKVSNTDTFILMLINIDYYNEKESFLEFIRVKNKYSKSTYIKVVFPLFN